MKKVFLVAVAGMFVLASCKKDRTCECTINGVTSATGSKVTYTKVTKKFMVNEAGCYSKTTNYLDGTSEKKECVIK